MTLYTHTIRVSDTLYRRLNRHAEADHKTVDEVAEQMLTRVLPSALETDTSLDQQVDIEQLQMMSDGVLWRIAQAEFPEQRTLQYDELLAARLERSLSDAEQEQLDILREETDALMVRKSAAYALLHQRGHILPNPYDVATYE
jgi:predicted transcriptional regulator